MPLPPLTGFPSRSLKRISMSLFITSRRSLSFLILNSSSSVRPITCLSSSSNCPICTDTFFDEVRLSTPALLSLYTCRCRKVTSSRSCASSSSKDPVCAKAVPENPARTAANAIVLNIFISDLNKCYSRCSFFACQPKIK